MARKILDVFGRIAIVFGLLAIGSVFMTAQAERWALFFVVAPPAAATVLAGALLVGFARVIELLESIERNTAGR